jgi:hypothetical protein
VPVRLEVSKAFRLRVQFQQCVRETDRPSVKGLLIVSAEEIMTYELAYPPLSLACGSRGRRLGSSMR